MEPNHTGKLNAALQTLRALNIAFGGPFTTTAEHRIYLVDGCALTESEIVALHEDGKFTSANIAKFLNDLRSLQSASELAPEQRRRSERVMVRLDVLVRWEIQEGSPLQTHAFTVAVNAHGGLMESPFRMTLGQQITLINPQTGREIRCTVVEVHRSSQGYFTTAFAFEQHSPQFWAVGFPPPDWEPA